MAFRKRNVDLSRLNASSAESSALACPSPLANVPRGTRPSAVDGRLTTSSGTPSLDGLLAGHGGLALGTSLLVEENGSTDYGGALLKSYAAEGVVQGHVVHVIGAGDSWGRNLPGLVEGSRDHVQSQNNNRRGEERGDRSDERMKIAWRYERSTQHSASAGIAGSRANPSPKSDSATASELDDFCHTFDLAKRLTVQGIADIKHHAISFELSRSPFADALRSISKLLTSTAGQSSIHRIVIPTLLSPALYPLHACEPQHMLQFVHQMRSLLRQFPQRLTIITTFPLEIYPRSTGLVRWLEIISDSVLELTPFPHASDDVTTLATSTATITLQEERPQGIVKLHKLPIFHERCGGGGGMKRLGDDLAFTVSRRRFAIGPFSLPPADGDQEAQQSQTERVTGKLTKDQIEF